MKKIFTLLFFTGLMSGVMAQNRWADQDRNQANGQSAAYARNSREYPSSNGQFSRQDQRNNVYGQGGGYNYGNSYRRNDPGFRQGNEGNYYGPDQRFNEWHDGRRFRRYDGYGEREYGYERRRQFERYDRDRYGTRFSIRFGQPSCY